MFPVLEQRQETSTQSGGERQMVSLGRFKIYSAMFLGRYRPAIEAAEEMVSTLPEELLEVRSPPMADWLEGFVSMKQHVLVR